VQELMRVLKRMIEATSEFLKSYFKRNLSESGFSSDKRRFGWLEIDAPLAHPRFCCAKPISSRRREQALFCTTLLHNIFFVRRAMS
jgi:transposase